MTCALLCHVGIQDRDIRREGTRFEHRGHVGKGFDCDACHSGGDHGRPGQEHGKVLPQGKDCLRCHHGAKAPSPGAQQTCAGCHGEADRFLRGTKEDGSEGPQMMREISCDACHDDPPGKPVLEAVKPRCMECHEGDAKYGSMAEDWSKDAREWRAAAEARLAKARAGGADPDLIAKAEAVLLRLKFAVPAHNILLFEEEKEAFDDAAKAAEKRKR